MALYSLAENCEYGMLKSEMIRDRLVVGIRDSALSQRLQLNAELTLEKAKQAIQAKGSGRRATEHPQRRQQTHCRCCSPGHGLREKLRREKPRSPRRIPAAQARKGEAETTAEAVRTLWKRTAPRSQCPAKDATCHKCLKSGHYSAQCQTKNVDESSLETAFLDATTTSTAKTA